jgi:hypothetical protein
MGRAAMSASLPQNGWMTAAITAVRSVMVDRMGCCPKKDVANDK